MSFPTLARLLLRSPACNVSLSIVLSSFPVLFPSPSWLLEHRHTHFPAFGILESGCVSVGAGRRDHVHPLFPWGWGGSLLRACWWYLGLLTWQCLWRVMDVAVAPAFAVARSPRVHGLRTLEVCNRPRPLRRSRGDGNGGPFALSLPFFLRSTPDTVPWPLYSCSPWSSRPQPLGSGGDTTPCEGHKGTMTVFSHQVLLQWVSKCHCRLALGRAKSQVPRAPRTQDDSGGARVLAPRMERSIRWSRVWRRRHNKALTQCWSTTGSLWLNEGA